MRIGNTKTTLATLFLLACVLPASADSFLTVQPVISGSTSLSPGFLQNEETFANAIFGQIGLDIDFLAPVSAPTLPSTYNGSNANESSIFFNSSSFQAAPVLTVWFVETITYNGNSDRGLSQQDGVNFASWIAASAVNDTLAHEIGNDLDDLQETTGNPAYLMEVGTDRNIPSSLNQIFPGSSYDQITAAQERDMLGNSQFVQSSAEPSSAILIVLGALMVVLAKASFWKRFRT